MDCIKGLICQKITSNTILSSKEIAEVIEQLILEYHLQNYISDVHLSCMNDRIVGEYSRTKRQIIYNADCMNRYVNVLFTSCNHTYEVPFYRKFYLFCQFVTIFHEVRHAIQSKMGESSSKIPKEHLINEIINDCFSINSSAYSDFYFLIPIEKEADVFAYSEVINLFRCVLGEQHVFLQKIKNLYYSQLYSGYHNRHKGTLEDFYVDVLNKPFLYLRYNNMGSVLTLYEKLGFNFDITKKDNEVIRGFFETDVMKNPVKVFSKK